MFCLKSKSEKILAFGIGLQRKFSNILKTKQLSSTPKLKTFKESRIINFSSYRKLFSTLADEDNKEVSIDYEGITGGNKELDHKLKVIILEAEVMRQEGKAVPDSVFITTDMWKEVLRLETRNARRKYLEYLFKLSKKKENRQMKKIQKKIEFEVFKEEQSKNQSDKTTEDQPIIYDLQHNNIFLRFYESTMNQMYNHRLVQAMMFGQKIVIDCGYDQNMSKRENLNCAKQLMLVFAENRNHDEPFDIHYCNLRPGTDLEKTLHKHIPTMYQPSFPINPHECSYQELFPKDRLVYLTPHCHEEMVNYDHDAVYIIGGIVDKINNEPLSLAKAKREGIKMQKFPLDRYLQWGGGSGKSLTLNQCISILLDVKATGDWQHALRHVPRRKIIDFSINNNIQNRADKLRFDRNRGEKKWVPSANKNFENVSAKKNENVRSGKLNIRSIFNE